MAKLRVINLCWFFNDFQIGMNDGIFAKNIGRVHTVFIQISPIITRFTYSQEKERIILNVKYIFYFQTKEYSYTR